MGRSLPSLPPVREIVRFVRSRVPIGPPVEHPDSPLPYVGRRPSTTPILPVHDMAVASAFYESLGFEVDQYDGGYAWVKHCSWEWFHLRLVDGLDPDANEASAYLHVDDAQAWRNGMTAVAHVDAIGEVTDKPWGMREFGVTDPSGNLVRLGQHL